MNVKTHKLFGRIQFYIVLHLALLVLWMPREVGADSLRVTQWDFEMEEIEPMTAHGDVVRDQPGPRPPEFPNFNIENTAIYLKGKGSRIEIPDAGVHSSFDFKNGDSVTMEAWVNVESLRSGQFVYIIGKGRTHSPHFSKENQNWSMRLVGEKDDFAHISFLFTSISPLGEANWHRWTSEATFEIASGWHHIAVAYEFGKPDSICGWIDGRSTKGFWDLSGPTFDPPVVDNDDVWIGSSSGGSVANSFQGSLDAVAIHRGILSDEVIANRFQREGGSQGVVVESMEMPVLGDIDPGKTIVTIGEGLKDYRRWPSLEEIPAVAMSWEGESFLLPRVPLRFDDWGIRSTWKPPILIRIASDVALPNGEHRFLLRARALARLWIDGELVAETKPATGRRSDGRDPVTPLAEPPRSGVRVKGYHQQEVFGSMEIPSGRSTSRVVLELIAGGKNQRNDTGEVVVAIESTDGCQYTILGPKGLPGIPLTDVSVEPVLAKIERSLSEFDDFNRRTSAKSRNRFWNERHAIAKDWVKRNPAPQPPRKGHPIDAFIDTKIEKTLAANTALLSEKGKNFHQNVMPILRESCYRCHGEKEKGGLRLDSLESALRGGDSELAAVVPGDPEASEMVAVIREEDEDFRMPPTGDPLTEEQIVSIENWIREGAPWPEPPISSEKLTKTALTPDESFLRRVYLDTVGVPPEADEVRAFLADESLDKRARIIDRLLANERSVDHAMSEWMDVLAENPTLINQSLNSTGPFRWFLHDSLIDRKAIDRMITELLMMRGDAAQGGSSGFSLAAENDAPFAEKGNIIASGFLGIELKCARCHDSPYHSTTQKDLFSLAAMLERKTVTVPKTSRVPAAFFEEKGRNSLIRATLKPDEPVAPEWPFAAETGVRDGAGLDNLLENPMDSRERLAALITSPENQRFSRVIVNRVWRRLMGAGFVEPVYDWEGSDPSHPELLDWLAKELVFHNYNLNHVTRLILTSEAYQREAGDLELASIDARERLFASPSRRRLTAEQIVDSLHTAVGASIDSEKLTLVHDGTHTLRSRQDLGTPTRAWMFTSLNNERDRPSLALPRAQTTVDVLKAFGWTGSRQKPTFERTTDPNVLQPGILANGLLTQNLSRAAQGSELAELAVNASSPMELLEELFLRFLGRLPNQAESDVIIDVLNNGFEERLMPPDWVEPIPEPEPLPLVTWLNHVSPQANLIQLEIEKRVEQGPRPDPRLHHTWREVYEDVVWNLMNVSEFVWIP